MTNEQLRKLIESDPEAFRLAVGGGDDACANRLSQIAPKVLDSTRWSYRGLSAVVPLQVLENLINSVDGHIESGGQFSGVVREMREYLRQDGLDISHASTQAMLEAWAASPLPLTPEDLASIKEAVSVPPSISGVDVANLGMFNPGAIIEDASGNGNHGTFING